LGEIVVRDYCPALPPPRRRRLTGHMSKNLTEMGLICHPTRHSDIAQAVVADKHQVAGFF
jgi:hypothetical protein